MGLLSSDYRAVMVVDDSEDIRKIICIKLRRKGYRVLEAANGKEAVEVATRSHPSLILMDLSMPVMDGYEATRRIKALPEFGDVPVVAISAFCDASTNYKAMEAGCVECVNKPIDFHSFDRLVSRYLQV